MQTEVLLASIERDLIQVVYRKGKGANVPMTVLASELIRAALLTVTASICFLTVTLGTTFAATQVVRIEDRASLPPVLRQHNHFLARQRTRSFRLIASRKRNDVIPAVRDRCVGRPC